MLKHIIHPNAKYTKDICLEKAYRRNMDEYNLIIGSNSLAISIFDTPNNSLGGCGYQLYLYFDKSINPISLWLGLETIKYLFLKVIAIDNFLLVGNSITQDDFDYNFAVLALLQILCDFCANALGDQIIYKYNYTLYNDVNIKSESVRQMLELVTYSEGYRYLDKILISSADYSLLTNMDFFKRLFVKKKSKSLISLDSKLKLPLILGSSRICLDDLNNLQIGKVVFVDDLAPHASDVRSVSHSIYLSLAKLRQQVCGNILNGQFVIKLIH